MYRAKPTSPPLLYLLICCRTYAEQGMYRAKLRVFNLASEFEMTNRVPVWAEIKNLTTMAYYLPFLPIGKQRRRKCSKVGWSRGFLAHFYLCNTIGLMLNFAKVGGTAETLCSSPGSCVLVGKSSLTLLLAGGLFLSIPRGFLKYLPNGLS